MLILSMMIFQSSVFSRPVVFNDDGKFGLKDENGNLKAEYTIEGMHIKEEGYRAIFPEFIRYAME